jgi:hypothetical protein
MTASVGGLYALPLFPLYAAAKHGALGLMRSITKPFFEMMGLELMPSVLVQYGRTYYQKSNEML